MDTPESQPIRDLRRELLAALTEMVDPGFRDRHWEHGQSTEDCLVSGFQPPLAIFDADVLDDPYAMVGATFRSVREAAAVEGVFIAITELFKDVGDRMECARPYIRSRRWRDVAAAASHALRAMSE